MMLTRIRQVLRTLGENHTETLATEDQLSDALTRIDEIIAHETRSDPELLPTTLSGDRYDAIAQTEWNPPQ